MPITSHSLEYGVRLSYIICYELQNNFDCNLFPLSHIFSLSDKDMYFFYILSQCQFQYDHDYKYHYWILFINGISQLFSFVTQTFPRRNPWRRRQSPSQRGRKCEPWKCQLFLVFFSFFSWEKVSHFSSKTWGSEATWCSCGLHPRRNSTFGSPVRSSFVRFHDPLWKWEPPSNKILKISQKVKHIWQSWKLLLMTVSVLTIEKRTSLAHFCMIVGHFWVKYKQRKKQMPKNLQIYQILIKILRKSNWSRFFPILIAHL